MPNSSCTLLIYRIICLVLCTCNLMGGLVVVNAQTRRSATRQGTTSKPSQKVSDNRSPTRCAGGWTGVVTYKKTLKDSLESDEPGIRKSIDRIIHRTSRSYDYTGRAIVDGTNPTNAAVKTTVAFTDNDLSWGEEKVWDSCHAFNDEHWFVIKGNDDRVTQAQVQGSARSFNLNVDVPGGTYSFSLAFPEAKGVYKREQHVQRSGHCQPKNNEPFDKSESQPINVSGESLSIDSMKIDPDSPDTLTGTKVWGGGDATVKSFIYQVSWHFTRCPQKLLITDIKFEHPKFPDFDNWKEIVPQLGTIDGNRVKVKVKVLNLSSEAKFADVKVSQADVPWRPGDYSAPGSPFPNGEFSIRLDGGEERELELIWNTEGESWRDDGRPHLLHRVRAEAFEDGQKKDAKTEDLNIAPKPVILVHGLWSSADAWIPGYQNALTLGHSYGWKAYPVGEKPAHGHMNTGGSFMSPEKSASIYDNADELAKYVSYAQEDANAWHVDMVAHSIGGLIARLYIHKSMPDMPDNAPLVKHLVMLGTPNAGATCADTMDAKFKLYGEHVQAIKDVTPEAVAMFNQYVNNRKRVKFSALAGNSVPITCGGYIWNDGFVSVESAIHGIEDFAYSNSLHMVLTNMRNFGNFVEPHLVTGPKGTYPLRVRSDPNDFDRWKIENPGFSKSFGFPGILEPNGPSTFSLGSIFVNAAYAEHQSGNSPDTGGSVLLKKVEDSATFSRELKLSPNQSTEIEVPVSTGNSFGLTLMAASQVSATLVDDKGTVQGRNTANKEQANAFFRSMFVDKPVVAGSWKLKLENTSSFEQVVLVAGWADKSTTPPAPIRVASLGLKQNL